MEHSSLYHVISGLLCAVLVCLPCTCNAAESTQADIDRVANNLDIKILVNANHMSQKNYTIAFQLKNVGRQRILNTNDWQILFSLNNPDMLTEPQFKVHGFTIKPWRESFYSMSADNTFPGLGPRQAFKITVTAKGLSVFRSDMRPRFIIRSPNKTVPKTIISTDDDSLAFVDVVPSNDPTNPTRAKQTAVDRAARLPEPMDMARVGPTLVIPHPKSIYLSNPNNVGLIDLATSPKFYITVSPTISQSFQQYIRESLSSIVGVTPNKLIFSVPRGDGDNFRFRLVEGANDTNPGAYTMDIAKGAINTTYGIFNTFEMNSTTEEGLKYAFESFKSIIGLYNKVPPFIQMTDEPRYAFRAITLDLSKHFFNLTTTKKFVDLMSMYKMNKLVLVLGDDYGWRIEMASALDIPELTTYGSRRCVTGDQCLPPYFGSGADGSDVTGGHFRTGEFIELIQYAHARKVDIIPSFNFFGGLLPAKRASEARYTRLQKTNKAEANRLHLTNGAPSVPTGTKLEEKFSFDGLMDHCSDSTMAFIETVIKSVVKMYASASIPLVGVQASGDELTQYLKYFPACASKSGAAILMDSLVAIRNLLPQTTRLHVTEEVITDPDSGHMIEEGPLNYQFKTRNQVVHFRKTFARNIDKLTTEQKQFLFAEVPPFPDPANPNAQPDQLKPFKGTPVVAAPWLLPYRAANKGYPSVMEPENFYALDSASEVDFDEIGRRTKDVAFFITLHRMSVWEPENMYINNDLTIDGQALLPYRMCKVFSCTPLTPAGKANIIGIGGLVNTENIRNPETLWHLVTPRLLMVAEKAWREAPHENKITAEDPAKMLNPQNVELRTGSLVYEMQMFSNTMSYKELGRLEVAGYTYRICKLGASILLGLQMGQKPPFPLVVKCGEPTPDIEYQEVHSTNKTWRRLFSVDPRSETLMGGYTFSFPLSEQKINIRVISPEGTRRGPSTYVEGNIKYYLPKDVPVDLREGTCLPIMPMEEVWKTDIEKMKPQQWNKVLENIDLVANDRETFIANRNRNLTDRIRQFNRQNRQNYNLGQVMQHIQHMMSLGQDIERVPKENILYKIHEADKNIYMARERFVENRYNRWQQEYLQCKQTQTPVTLQNPNTPPPPAAGPIPHTTPPPPPGMGPFGPGMGGPGMGGPGMGGPGMGGPGMGGPGVGPMGPAGPGPMVSQGAGSDRGVGPMGVGPEGPGAAQSARGQTGRGQTGRGQTGRGQDTRGNSGRNQNARGQSGGQPARGQSSRGGQSGTNRGDGGRW